MSNRGNIAVHNSPLLQDLQRQVHQAVQREAAAQQAAGIAIEAAAAVRQHDASAAVSASQAQQQVVGT